MLSPFLENRRQAARLLILASAWHEYSLFFFFTFLYNLRIFGNFVNENKAKLGVAVCSIVF